MGEQGTGTTGKRVDLDLDAVLGGTRTVRLDGRVYDLHPMPKALRRELRLASPEQREAMGNVGLKIIRACVPGLSEEDVEDLHPAQAVALMRAIMNPVTQAETLVGESSAAANETERAGSASGGSDSPATSG